MSQFVAGEAAIKSVELWQLYMSPQTGEGSTVEIKVEGTLKKISSGAGRRTDGPAKKKNHNRFKIHNLQKRCDVATKLLQMKTGGTLCTLMGFFSGVPARVG